MFIDCHFQGDSGLIIPGNQKRYSIQSVVTEFIAGVLIYFPLPTDFFSSLPQGVVFPQKRSPPPVYNLCSMAEGFLQFLKAA